MAETTGRLTIDQLAGRVGMTTRNVRAYQARGLLPPPVLEGRTGFYGEDHVVRLLQVKALQDEGLNLAAIAKVLIEGSLSKVLLQPFAAEAPYEVRADLLAGQLRADADGVDAGRAVELGLIELVDDETARVLVPAAIRRSQELGDMGVPLSAQLEAVAVVHRACHEVADAFVALGAEHLLVRVASEVGADEAAIGDAVDRLGAIAADVVAALFLQAMTDKIRDLVGE